MSDAKASSDEAAEQRADLLEHLLMDLVEARQVDREQLIDRVETLARIGHAGLPPVAVTRGKLVTLANTLRAVRDNPRARED